VALGSVHGDRSSAGGSGVVLMCRSHLSAPIFLMQAEEESEVTAEGG